MAEDEWISLNVGGRIFFTSRTTLTCKEPSSVLARMFSRRSVLMNTDEDTEASQSHACVWNNRRDPSGAYLIDRSPEYFEPILNFLRHGQLIVDKNVNLQGVLEEAKFYGLVNLPSIIEEELEKSKPPGDSSPLKRREVVNILMKTPFSPNNQLRFQGINFADADLSYLDLRNVNFKYANLQGANMMCANLSHCNFERANLSHTILDGAHLLAAKMSCANLDHASIQGCNFEDPLQTMAVLEGASLKYANLDGSQMSGVNLRVACLKNAILRNCDLKGAVLAGADLENCDLSGSDLQEANLRGANFKGATFELLPTPLHMSQAIN